MIYVCNYTAPTPPDSCMLPADSPSATSWHRHLSPGHVGPVTVWGGAKCNNLHNALLSCTYTSWNPGLLENRALALWYAPPHQLVLWKDAVGHCWGDVPVDVVDWRMGVMLPLCVEAYTDSIALHKLLDIEAVRDVALRDTGAACWAGDARRTLTDILQDEDLLFTPAHVLAAMLTDDPVLGLATRWE